jgi:uncharacterized protein YyaL (SSP411 family)
LLPPPSAPVQAKTINWRTDFDAARREAEQARKYRLLFFHTEWCGYCRLMLERTFTDAGVIALVTEKFIPVKLDAEKEEELSRRYNITGYPTTVIIDPRDREVGRVAGYLPPKECQKMLQDLIEAK